MHGRSDQAAPGAPLWFSGYNEGMASRIRSKSTRSRPQAVRQSVTIPAAVAAEVRTIARQRRLTMSRALVTLAERGIQADKEARQRLKAAYKRFMKEQEPARKNEAGQDLIRAIFGKDALAEDSLP